MEGMTAREKLDADRAGAVDSLWPPSGEVLWSPRAQVAVAEVLGCSHVFRSCFFSTKAQVFKLSKGCPGQTAQHCVLQPPLHSAWPSSCRLGCTGVPATLVIGWGGHRKSGLCQSVAVDSEGSSGARSPVPSSRHMSAAATCFPSLLHTLLGLCWLHAQVGSPLLTGNSTAFFPTAEPSLCLIGCVTCPPLTNPVTRERGLADWLRPRPQAPLRKEG